MVNHRFGGEMVRFILNLVSVRAGTRERSRLK